ncbi:hypothetical protein LO772_11475 [Yinghuangia sp. ASG 101]|uniref:hypothetical protein n=1 Tax=Yinghuangia sp. ASG 101 TaxID=2896848 RepID=UPI001E2F6E55|nr:hypothetical protein [Yinghuangia sp. ASG 101]UGQ14156.1 hypothetical protein LO772_11475 [Yinghuangia sp. ASG 101]
MDDNSWRAAQAAREPVVEGMTHSGLPRRLPQANLVPGAAVDSVSTFVPGIFAGLSRDPQDVRNRLASFVQGLEQARSAADAQLPPVPPNPMRAPSPLATAPVPSSPPNKAATAADPVVRNTAAPSVLSSGEGRGRRRDTPVEDSRPSVQHPPMDGDQSAAENPWGDGWKAFRPGA